MTRPDSFDENTDLASVDALRGYAILLVFATHITPLVPNLVWPAKRLLLVGIYGVQLFFVASALTLMMSWARSRDAFAPRTGKFLLRRFFRIAPLYFLAIPFYWLVHGRGAEDFSGQILLANLFFYNAWSPYLIPTVPGWIAVPGGWSISVEFCFYFVFPLIALWATTLARASAFLALALAVMLLAAGFGAGLYPEIPLQERQNFLYYWPPNHLVVFALGFVLYHTVKSPAVRSFVQQSRVSSGLATLIMAAGLIALSFYGQRKFWEGALPPSHLLVSVMFAAWALVVVLKPSALVVNRFIVGLGKLSFSAYVLHFAALHLVALLLQPLAAWTGVGSIAFAFILAVLAFPLTWATSLLTYRFIEQPFISFGKRLIQNHFAKPQVQPA